jgi:hypothetical protein
MGFPQLLQYWYVEKKMHALLHASIVCSSTVAEKNIWLNGPLLLLYFSPLSLSSAVAPAISTTASTP